MQIFLISATLAATLTLPVAQRVDESCGEPPAIQFASIDEASDEDYSFGSTVKYECEYGYTPRGKSRILRCVESDSKDSVEWTLPQFSCIPQSCGDPGYVNNGRRVGSLFTFPNSVTYECDEGHRLKGLATRYCQTSGSWSGRLPICEEITCYPPPNLSNGYVTYNSLEYGSELQYKCQKGFRLNIEETVFCDSDGSWSNMNVQCVESVCDIPLQPEHGSVQLDESENNPRAGSIIIFSCNGDKIADGPTISKCLDNGKWTFPPPKCLDPCSIPYVTNGEIGRLVRDGYRWRNKVFRKVPVGDKIDDDEELVLRCSEGYEISDSNEREGKISCSHGKWTQEPSCDPASCNSDPPFSENSRPVTLQQAHGRSVLYLCNKDFRKTMNETVICDFGKWKGSAPVCKDTRCPVDDLSFPGLVKGRKTIYKDGEVFAVECEPKYHIANRRLPRLKCEDGNWNGTLPPCVAASCDDPPPQIEFGRPEVSSTAHSSIVKYVCVDPYTLVGDSQVHCSFGEWEGQSPKCEDSRCYLKSLPRSAYVDIVNTPTITASGNRLQVACKVGYSPRSEQPLCLKGQWTQNSNSPCREDDCIVPLLYHGDIEEHILGDWYYDWWKVRYNREMKHIKNAPGSIVSYGSSRQLVCHNGYFFQGSREKSKTVTCYASKWLPAPVCLLRGQVYVPTTISYKTSKVTESFQTAYKESKNIPAGTTSMSLAPTTTTTTTNEPALEEAVEEIPKVDEEIPKFEKQPPEKECYCEYSVSDENLVAHADGKRLKYQDKVKNGSLVMFRCLHVGFHHLRGPKTIKCEECRNWHSSEIPTCLDPERGSAVILLNRTLNISEEGSIEITKGQNIKLMCIAIESRLFPSWRAPIEDRITITRERMERESYGDVLYVSHLVIQNADIENEGPYECAVGNNSMNSVKLVVIDPNLRCPEFQEEDGIIVTYNMERRVKSQASFSCAKQNQELIGKAVLTCQNYGQWSDPPPQCADLKCKELKGNELLSIYYTMDRTVGSFATFHCFAPGQRSGAARAKCLENGTWSDPTPICRTPPCSLENLFPALPEFVVPDMDNTNETFPYNTTIILTCLGDMIVEGSPVAKCGLTGEWEYQNIQCISGCPAIIKPDDSDVFLKPEKDVYKLGDMVTFSCPLGMSLDTQSQVIMCLKYGWSEIIFPKCEYNFMEY